MTILKTIAVWLYNRFVPADEKRVHAINELDHDDRYSIALTMFARGIHQLDKTKLPYRKAVQVAEDLLVLHHKVTDFPQLCRDHVTYYAPGSYHIKTLLSGMTSVGVDGALSLLTNIEPSRKLAKQETSFIKRRSLLRNAIKLERPELDSNQLSLAVELVLALD